MFGWTEEMDNIVLEQLRIIRATLDDLKVEVRNFNSRVSANEHQLAGFLLSGASQSDEIDLLKARMDRVERRLDLRD